MKTNVKRLKIPLREETLIYGHTNDGYDCVDDNDSNSAGWNRFRNVRKKKHL